MKRLLMSILTMVMVIGLVGGGYFAYFRDTETSSDNTFTAGILDLAIDCYTGITVPSNSPVISPSIDPAVDDPPKIFDSLLPNNLAPGDKGQTTISLHLKKDSINADLWMQVINLVPFDASIDSIHPQFHVAPDADISDNILIKVWLDTIHNNSLDGTETVVCSTNLRDLVDNVRKFAVAYNVAADETKYVGWSWEIPASLGNEYQGDSCTFDIVFGADQVTGYFLSTAVLPTLTGTVAGAGSYDAGTNAPVLATGATGYHFDYWTGDLASGTNPESVLMNAPKSVTAHFAINTYTLTYSAGAGGSITGTSPQTVNHGADGSAVTAIPDAGFAFVDWSDASTDNPRTDTGVTSSISVTANFASSYTAARLNPDYGYDATPLTPNRTLTPAELDSLADSDDSRYQSFEYWEYGFYIDSEAIDFEFPEIPAGSIVTSAELKFEWQRQSGISAARLRISGNGGSSWAGPYDLTMPTAGVDQLVSLDLFSNPYGINSFGEVNDLVVRFQAYDGSSNVRTLHNWVQVNVTYTPPVILTTSVSPGGSGSITMDPTGGAYASGTVVTVTAVPAAGYSFSSWSDDLGGSTNPTTIAMDGNKTITANFVQQEYTLTINTTGSGSVARNPDQATYHYGDVVQLTATPAEYWSFGSWSGGATGSANPTSVTLNGNTTVGGTFTVGVTVTLPAIKDARVNSSSGNTNYGGDPYMRVGNDDRERGLVQFDLTSVPAGMTINSATLRLYAYSSSSPSTTATFGVYRITGGTWTESTVTSNNQPLGSSTPSADLSTSGTGWKTWNVTADAQSFYGNPSTNYGWKIRKSSTSSSFYDDFRTKEYTTDASQRPQLVVTYAPGKVLTISAGTGGTITTPGSGTYTYASGTVVTITASANTGYTFANWTGAVANANLASTTVTMDTDKTVTATFTQNNYTLTASVLPADAATAGCGVTGNAGSYHYGDSVSLTAGTVPGWAFNGWTGTYTGSNAVLAFSMPASNVAVTANYVRTYTLNVSAGTGGTITTPGSGIYTYNSGTVVTITASPNGGYAFVNWTGDAVANANAASTTITMNGNKTVTANFAPTYALTIARNPITGGTVTGAGTYVSGTVVNISASQNPGYAFVNWTGDTVANANAASTTITMNGNRSITANFGQAEYTLTVNTTGSGSVAKNPDQPTYHYGDTVQLTATPTAGWSFGSWSGGATGSVSPVNVTINANTTVGATFTAGVTVTLPATRDTYVYSGSSEVNYGGSDAMSVGGSTYRSLIDFSLSSIPSNMVVSSAELRLYCYSETATSSASVSAYRITGGAWDESAVNWTNQPNDSGSATDSVSTQTTGWKSWDVTADVQGFYGGSLTNYGWKIRKSSGSVFNFRTKEYATDTALRPQLVVTYAPILHTTTLSPSQDSFIDASSPTTSQGSATQLRVSGGSNGGTTYSVRNALVQFNLSSLPAGAVITSAQLGLTVTSFDGSNGPGPVAVYSVTGPWTNSVTWNSAPSSSATPTDDPTSYGTTAPYLATWDVATDVQAIVSGSSVNNGWMLAHGDDGNATSWYVASVENSTSANRPQLVISYYAP